jgi:hypothetical protein
MKTLLVTKLQRNRSIKLNNGVATQGGVLADRATCFERGRSRGA